MMSKPTSSKNQREYRKFNSGDQHSSIIGQHAQRQIEMGNSQYTQNNLEQFDQHKYQVNVQTPTNYFNIFITITKWITIFVLLAIGIVVGSIGWYYYHILYTDQFQLIGMLSQVKQLPFCFLLFPSVDHSLNILKNSVQAQNYTNYNIIEISQKSNNYFDFKNRIKNQCAQYPVVMFLDSPLKFGAISQINNVLQRYRAWIVYAEDQKSKDFEVFAFFYRIYELLDDNDFERTNFKYLNQNNREVQALSLLELSQKFKYKIDSKLIKSKDSPTYFSYKAANIKKYQRKPFKKLLRLSQDYNANITQFQSSLKYLIYHTFSIHFQKRGLFLLHMLKALDRQQLIYLPKNHTIEVVQREEMNKKYQINTFSKKIYQLPFCVTVMSHNNIQNNRYIKALRSILQQQYQNYHIVFFDDNSTDETMNRTIQYMKSQRFPENRVRYVQNIKRNYATYNIINAAYNFCHEDDIQVLIDGDDQFIGRYAFQTINTFYQFNNQLWIVYSNFKTNYHRLGFSQKLLSMSQLSDEKGKRVGYFYFGPIRTWRVKLIHSMPYQYHKHSDGTWLDTSYDNAIIYSITERSGKERVQYIKQIFYEYNVNYGDNDNASDYRLMRRLEVYNHIKSLQPLERLNKLSDAKKDERVVKELREGLGVRFQVLED